MPVAKFNKFGLGGGRNGPGSPVGGLALNQGGGVAAFTAAIQHPTNDGSVGQTYSVSASSGAAATYQWVQRGVGNIVGATGQTYVAVIADLGKFLDCDVTIKGLTVRAFGLWRVLEAPIILANGATGWSQTGGVTIASDTAHAPTGGTTIEMGPTGAAATITAQKQSLFASVDPNTLGVIWMPFTQGGDPEFANASVVKVELTRGGTPWAGAPAKSLSDRYLGTHSISFHASDLTGVPAAGVGELGAKISTTHTAPAGGKVWAGPIIAKAKGQASIIIGMDDDHFTQYTTALPALNARSLKGVVYLAKNYIGQAGKCDVPQTKAFEQAGHEIASNGTSTDGSVTSFADMTALAADYAANCQFMDDNGIVGAGRRCINMPNGAIRTAGTRVQKTSTTNGSTTVVVNTNTSLVEGMKVAGYRVPDGTYIAASGISGTSITLTQAIPTGTTLLSFTNVSGPWHTGKAQVGLVNMGIQMARLATQPGNYSENTRFNLGSSPSGRSDGGGYIMEHWGTNLTDFADVAAFTTAIDNCIRLGQMMEIFFHGVEGVPSAGNTATAHMLGCFDVIAARRDADLIDNLVPSQIIARDLTSTIPF